MFWQMSRVLCGGGAIGSPQPSEVTVSVTVQGRSEMEMETGGGEGNPCIESSCRDTGRPESSFLRFSDAPATLPRKCPPRRGLNARLASSTFQGAATRYN